MKTEEMMVEFIKEFGENPAIIKLKKKIETGDITQNLILEQESIKEAIKNNPSDKFSMIKLLWLYFTFFSGDNGIKQLKLFNNSNIDNLPIGEEFFNRQKLQKGINDYIMDNRILSIDEIKDRNEVAKIAFGETPSIRLERMLLEKMPTSYKIIEDDKNNPLIFDYKLITHLHRDFKDDFFADVDIDTFKNWFRKIPVKAKKRDGISINALCHFFGMIEHKQTGVSNFSDWMKNHIDGNNYGNGKIEYREIGDTRKEKGFTPTTSQKKALELKDKIDNRLQMILSD